MPARARGCAGGPLDRLAEVNARRFEVGMAEIRCGIALHAGANPGYPASKGCVRLPAAFASKLFAMTKVGDRVVIG